jgi:hypothetical protein
MSAKNSIPILLIAGASLLLNGCAHWRELAYRPQEGQVLRRVIHDERTFRFPTNTLVATTQMGYDLERIAINGRPGKNTVTILGVDFKANPWDHPAVHGRAAGLASIEGQVFKVEMDTNFQTDAIHLGGNSRKASVVEAFWAFGEEALVYPGFFQPSTIRPGKSWSGKFKNGRASYNYTFTADSATEEGDNLIYQISGELDGTSRESDTLTVKFNAKFKGEFDHTNNYFRSTEFRFRNKGGSQFDESRILRMKATHFDEYERPPFEKTGLSEQFGDPKTGIVIDSSDM